MLHLTVSKGKGVINLCCKRWLLSSSSVRKRREYRGERGALHRQCSPIKPTRTETLGLRENQRIEESSRKFSVFAQSLRVKCNQAF